MVCIVREEFDHKGSSLSRINIIYPQGFWTDPEKEYLMKNSYLILLCTNTMLKCAQISFLFVYNGEPHLCTNDFCVCTHL